MNMRIRPLERSEASFSARLLFSAIKRQIGKVITPLRVQAYRPGIMWAMTGMTVALEYSKAADKQVKRLVSLRTAQIVGCPF
jgi:alkylhydroperoxidase family enzyme